jgi:acetyl-CoA acetyltransferase
MPKAVVPAARKALEHAGIGLGDLKALKTHNPFAVNDVLFCKETGWPAERMNRYGSPLVYGHPQAPTGCRLVIELIEELVEGGGGWGLFSGCAAGDTAMAVVVKVG